ncbi:MAG: hypothetical protein RMM29_00855 [Planctomycetota bacterium]|nr:hypothetical protein [Planctomycetota bacterium]
MISAALSVPYGNHPRQRLDVFVPAATESALICSIDAGWWADGRCERGRGFALLLAGRGYAVATLGHRPLGEGARTGDEVLTDLANAACRALEEAQVLGFDGSSLVLVGHGSGSLAAFCLLPRLAHRVPVRALAALGVLATLEQGHGTAAAHIPACDRFAMARHKDLSPLRQDPADWPPLLLLHGEHDREVPLAQAQALAAHAAGSGEAVRCEVIASAGYGFAEDALAPTSGRVLALLSHFLQEHGREGPREASPFSARAPS